MNYEQYFKEPYTQQIGPPSSYLFVINEKYIKQLHIHLVKFYRHVLIAGYMAHIKSVQLHFKFPFIRVGTAEEK